MSSIDVAPFVRPGAMRENACFLGLSQTVCSGSWIFALLFGEKWSLSAVPVFVHLFLNETDYLFYVEEPFRAVNSLLILSAQVPVGLRSSCRCRTFILLTFIHLQEQKAARVKTCNTVPTGCFSWLQWHTLSEYRISQKARKANALEAFIIQ